MQTTAESLYQQARTFLLNTPPDYAKAAPLLRQSAHAGHDEAAFQLAGCLMNGMGMRQDFAAALEYLQQAARGGHGYARYNLLQLQENKGVKIAALLPHYTELAEQGLAQAQLRLMRAYNEAGKIEQAIHWAQRAAAQNQASAQYFLAQHYQYAACPDVEKAHQLYLRAAEQGLVAAHWQLGLQYKLGQGTAQDWAQAQAHLKIAAEHDIAPAQTALAEILLPQNPAEALKWFQTAAQQGDNDARVALAEIYLLGTYAERDPELARLYAEAAAQNRHAEALRLLGDIYRYGLSVDIDRSKARHYYRQAADLGSLAAHQKLLSDHALQGDEGYAQTKKAALQQQQAENLYRQAFAAHHGLQRKQDYAEALSLYRQAAQLGHGKAQTNLGMMYYSGYGVAADLPQAARWFTAAAQQNDSAAQYHLACLYFHGMGVATSPHQACVWLQKAIDCGHPEGEALRNLLAQWRKAV